MQTIRSISKMQSVSRRLAAEGKRIGLVPTMGFLHEGHLSLIKRARKEADAVIITIFVNPTQFAPNEDFDRYPRDEKGDARKIKAAGGDIIFIPQRDDIYPEDYKTYVNVEDVTDMLEGKLRPGHFRGVTTIVAKLYNMTRPDVVVFGMKDYQQSVVLRTMTRDLGYPIKYVVAPTVRERDGLAMSSRNKYLNPQQRAEAICLYRALKTAKEMVKAGETKVGPIEKEMRAVIAATCPSASIDYIAFNDIKTIAPHKIVTKGTVCSLAIRIGPVRLIDNMKLK
jgi:pantoate--beta-alanine ligase